MENPRQPSRVPLRLGRVTDADLRRERARLRRAFAAVLVALAPAPILEACEQEGPRGTDAGTSLGPDAGADAPALLDGDAAPLDAAADVQACNAVVVTMDAAPDAPGDAASDAYPGCTYQLPCGLTNGLSADGCDVYIGDTALGCSLLPDAGCSAVAYAPPAGGVVQIFCPGCLGGGGRRPRGLRPARPRGAPTPLGAYFARMAHEEAAAVHAFRRMHDELAAHGAPPALRRAAARSARDEERHARVMAQEARRHGALVSVSRVRRGPGRTLEAIARENAVEGCVHETFGALVAAWQAAHAPDASLRQTFQRIAADEARHAALSWALARWAEARLDPAARARVATARVRAVRVLRRMRRDLVIRRRGRQAEPLASARSSSRVWYDSSASPDSCHPAEISARAGAAGWRSVQTAGVTISSMATATTRATVARSSRPWASVAFGEPSAASPSRA